MICWYLKKDKMKNIVITLFIAVFCWLNVNAQENNESQTLLGDKLPKISDLGFYISPGYRLSQFDEASASLFHVRAGISLKKSFTVGAFYNVSINQIKPKSEVIPNIYMDYWNTGGFLEYTLLSKKLLHLTMPIYIAYGEVEMDNEIGELDFGEANFISFEPHLLLELNLHKYAKFNIGGGYRWVSEMNYRNFNQNDLTGIVGHIGFKFGLF